MRLKSIISATLILTMFAGCSKKEEDNDDVVEGDGFNGPRGVVQGFIIDGVTNKPVEVADFKIAQGVRVLAHNKLLPGYNTSKQNSSDTSLVGEFTVPNIPLDETFPLIVDLPGYQKFQGYVQIDSTLKPKAPQAVDPQYRHNPTLVANIIVFPVQAKTQDLTFKITSDAAPVANAQVRLQYNRNTVIDSHKDDAFFLSPVNTRISALNATTDAQGVVKFSKEGLVLGGTYSYTVIPPFGGQDEEIKKGEIIVGASAPDGLSLGGVTQNFVNIDLLNIDPQLSIVSVSNKSGQANQEGKIVIIFNRDIELVPNSDNNLIATLNGVTEPQNVMLNENKPDKGSETVAFAISGNTVTLTPKFKDGKIPDFAIEKTLSVTYSGLVVRPVSGSYRNTSISVEDLSVKF